MNVNPDIMKLLYEKMNKGGVSFNKVIENLNLHVDSRMKFSNENAIAIDSTKLLKL